MSEEAQVALLLCDKHDEEEMDVYCVTCKRPTCIKCLTTDHQGHEVETISKLSKKISNRRPDILQELKIKTDPIREKNRRYIRNVKCGNETLLMENLENAERKRAELHKTVDTLIDSQIDFMKTHSAKLDEAINNEVGKLHEIEEELLKILETFEKTTMVGLYLIEYLEKLQTKVDTLKTLEISQFQNKQVYTMGDVNRTRLQGMIGKVKEINENAMSIQMMSSFQKNAGNVGSICPISSDTAWFTYNKMRKIACLEQNGHEIKSVKMDLSGLGFIPISDGFLCCNVEMKNILKVDLSGKSSVWIDTSPKLAVCVSEALNGNILIALVDESSGIITDNSQGRVQMLSPTGDVLYSYECPEGGATPPLAFPTRVIQNYKSDICVVNVYGKDEKDYVIGNVYVFYEDGGLQFVYKGQEGDLNPFGICCDSLCNILCSNNMDSSIHVVNSEGVFLKYLFSPVPVTLALHKSVLWVGSEPGEVRVYRYNH